MKMANSRHRNEKLQTYRALALMWFLIGTSAIPVASSKAAVMGQMNVALSRRICMVSKQIRLQVRDRDLQSLLSSERFGYWFIICRIPVTADCL